MNEVVIMWFMHGIFVGALLMAWVAAFAYAWEMRDKDRRVADQEMDDLRAQLRRERAEQDARDQRARQEEQAGAMP